MKYHVKSLVLLAVASAVIARFAPLNDFEEGIRRVIEKCKDGNIESLPLPFPSLKPLRIPYGSDSYDGYNMDLTDIKIEGFEDLELRKLSASRSDLTLSLEVFIPTLAIRADSYHLTGTAMFFFGIDDEGVLRYNMDLTDIKIEGFEDLELRKLSASRSDLTLSLEVFIPTLAIRADSYHLTGTAMFFFGIDDEGVLRCNIDNLKVQANIQFGAEGHNTVIAEVDVNYLVDDFKVRLSGSNSTVNSEFKGKITEMMNNGEIKKRVQNLIRERTRKYLRGHTPQEFVDIISAI